MPIYVACLIICDNYLSDDVAEFICQGAAMVERVRLLLIPDDLIDIAASFDTAVKTINI